MKRLLSLVGAVAFSVAPGLHAGTIDLPVYGFQIEGLEAPVGAAPVTAVMTFLPATAGFAPNVNVQVQPFAGTIQDYIKLSTEQFAQVNWKVVNQKQVSDTEWVTEYSGAMEGNNLHFYARALLKGGKVYLATGTATETQWPTVGAAVRQSVDSLQLK